MKVVLFCGGLGLRIRETEQAPGLSLRRASDVPKPLQLIGGQSLLHHVMSWYAGWGHTHFILCLGIGGDLIHQWVRGSAVTVVDEPSPREGVTSLRLVGGDKDGWRVDLVDTGCPPTGQRFAQVRDLVAEEPLFLANYADGLCDVPLDSLMALAEQSGPSPTFLAVTDEPALGELRSSDGLRLGRQTPG